MNGLTALPAGGERLPPRPRLLLAEDDFFLRSFLDEVLHGDYAVEAVADGDQAWAAAQRQPPDLILSDVVRAHGLVLTRRLRADARTAKVPIVLLTASNQTQTLFDAAQAGADACLRKPFKLSELLDCLRRLAGSCGAEPTH